jgi:acetyl-CoA decarbonylase/synthase complex subunit gamma
MGAAESVTFLCKYAGIVVMPNSLPWQVLSVLTARQNIYTDPQKPLCVKAGIYQVGPVTQDSPVLVTTNFSLTYYTVEAEIEASKKPAYIIACDADGMSVLTAWAADKFTADTISKVLKSSGITDKVSHRTIVLPGYVAVLSAKLEEASGWKVVVGPREASSIPSFLRNYKG